MRGKSVLFVAVVVAIFGAIWFSQRFGRVPLSQREVATRVLAEYVRKTAKPRVALVVSNPFSLLKGRPAEVYAFQSASESGLRAGFGPEVNVKIGFPKLKPEAVQDAGSVFVDPGTTTPLSYLVAAEAFDDLLREHSDCEVFVSLIGLPVNTVASAFWNKPSPRLALLLPDLRILGGAEVVRQSFKSGKIVAAVAAKPGASFDEKASESNYKEEFEKRFVLITGDNIDQTLGLLFR